tara:strand:+ start:14 stop:181 length:168 start_codon:yes stop_codon:yes gene_type:complete
VFKEKRKKIKPVFECEPLNPSSQWPIQTAKDMLGECVVASAQDVFRSSAAAVKLA